jgi:hypothetical protein
MCDPCSPGHYSNLTGVLFVGSSIRSELSRLFAVIFLLLLILIGSAKQRFYRRRVEWLRVANKDAPDESRAGVIRRVCIGLVGG